MMRKLKYYIACSSDGFICDKNGSADGFLTSGEHLSDLFELFPETVPTHLRERLGIKGENRHFDTVLMGRNTYEVGLRENITNPYSTLDQYLFSKSMNESPDDNVTLIKEGAFQFIEDLKKKEGKAIWLCGGSELASALFSQIDELILKVNPFLIGSGIPLFANKVEPTQLGLINSRAYSNGFVLLHYHFKKPFQPET